MSVTYKTFYCSLHNGDQGLYLITFSTIVPEVGSVYCVLIDSEIYRYPGLHESSIVIKHNEAPFEFIVDTILTKPARCKEHVSNWLDTRMYVNYSQH